MSKLREKIDGELSNMSLECDVKAFEKRYSRRKNLTRAGVAAAAVVCLVGVAALGLTLNSGTQGAPKAEDENKNSFFITAYAAEVDGDASADTASEYEILDDKRVIIPEYRLVVHEIEQPEKTYKTFNPQGTAEIGITGENISKVRFHSEISAFRYTWNTPWDNDLELENKERNSVYWGLPEEYSYWMETQNEPDYIFEFSDLPRDTVTITVTFNDGSVQKKSLYFYFNDDGCLVIE